MSREVRKVPANWEHPKDEKGHLIPLLNGSFSAKLHQYEEGACQWILGNQRNYDSKGPKFVLRNVSTGGMTFEEWKGEIPKQKDYMPDWPEAERTHYQMYETTTEGTPISPVMETPEVLARWLADNNASAFGGMGATYDQWLATINRGWAVSAIIVPGKGLIVSGVEGLHEK